MTSLDNTFAFLVVCEEGSFLAAADVLGIATSTVSRRVGQLETELGAALLERSTHGLKLTEAGRVYRQHTAFAPELLANARDAVRSTMRMPAGRLRIAAPSDLVRTTLGDIALDYAREFPDVSLEVVGTDEDVVPDGDQLHLALRVTRSPPPEGLVQRRLGGMPMTICAAPGYLDEWGPITSPDDLLDRPAIVLGSARGAARIRLKGRDGTRELTVPIALFTTSVGLARRAGLQGLGPVGLPTPACAPWLEKGELIEVLPEYELEPVPMVLLFAGDRRVPYRVRTLIDRLVFRFSKTAFAGASDPAR